MSKVHRLSRAEITEVITSRSPRVHGRFFSLIVSPGRKPQFACVVSKKVAAEAIERNLIKRRCHGALREIAGGAPLRVVFHAKSSAAGAAYKEIRSDILSLMKTSPRRITGRRVMPR